MTAAEKPTVVLTANQKIALMAWAQTDEDFDVLSFKAIATRSMLPQHQVRRTVRAMARKGVTRFVRGCWTDDGEPMGSGYGLTEVGRALLSQAEADEDDKFESGNAAYAASFATFPA